jgi:glycosyltransferase involved in cell wall biosynthesis
MRLHENTQFRNLPAAPQSRSDWPWTAESALTLLATLDASRAPKISIVTPSYNQGQYLEATIRSVLLQDYPNLEYMIVDGGSTDNSVEIIRKYEPWLAYWVSAPDNGQADAINRGFDRATGEICGWLNSDDIYEPGALQRVARTLTSNPDVDLVYGNGWQIDADGAKTTRCHWVGPLDPATQLNWNQILQPAALWRRDVWNQAGQLDPSYNWGLDWEWFIRASKVGRTFFIPDDLADWRITPEIKSVSPDPARRAELASISRRHGGVIQPTYYMYQLDRLAYWASNRLGRSLLGRLPQFPLTAIRLLLRKRLAGRYAA